MTPCNIVLVLCNDQLALECFMLTLTCVHQLIAFILSSIWHSLVTHGCVVYPLMAPWSKQHLITFMAPQGIGIPLAKEGCLVTQDMPAVRSLSPKWGPAVHIMVVKCVWSLLLRQSSSSVQSSQGYARTNMSCRSLYISSLVCVSAAAQSQVLQYSHTMRCHSHRSCSIVFTLTVSVLSWP